ncbi:hypothetical protein [Novipirellula artificiosorum]|nr:hypothetical protein [Novipirellula artificiosorum]
MSMPFIASIMFMPMVTSGRSLWCGWCHRLLFATNKGNQSKKGESIFDWRLKIVDAVMEVFHI